jgi:DNA-binding GntR family transcriptional regulator
MMKKQPSTPAGTRRQLAYDHILRKVTAGEVRAGSALHEIPLAKELGISRTPIREAIGQLVAEGVLHESPGRGASFVEPSRREIIELYELREALEVYAARKAAREGIRRKESEVLGGLVEEIRTCRLLLKKSGEPVLRGELLQQFLTADFRFHMLLLQSAGNERIAKVAAHTRLLIRIFTIPRQHHSASLLEQIEVYHRDVLESVKQGDSEKAGRVLGEHIRLSMEERLAEYEDPRHTS